MSRRVKALIETWKTEVNKVGNCCDQNTMRRAIEDLEAATCPQWIHVNDDLPCEFRTVLMLTTDRAVRLFGYWTGIKWVSYGLGVIDDVTHWHDVEMDYPEPPQ